MNGWKKDAAVQKSRRDLRDTRSNRHIFSQPTSHDAWGDSSSTRIAFTLPKITYLVNTISVHQSRLVYPVDIECTKLEHEVHVGPRFGRRSDRRVVHGVVTGRSIVSTGGVRLLRGRNERHALGET